MNIFSSGGSDFHVIIGKIFSIRFLPKTSLRSYRGDRFDLDPPIVRGAEISNSIRSNPDCYEMTRIIVMYIILVLGTTVNCSQFELLLLCLLFFSVDKTIFYQYYRLLLLLLVSIAMLDYSLIAYLF